MDKFGIGLDIGTTTVQAQLVNINTGESLETISALNDQRSFGADVMSRIYAAQNGKTGELFNVINHQAEGILRQFIRKWNLPGIEQCVVSGNTTMLHLFAGVDPSAMGEAPFTPVFLEERYLTGKELSLSAAHITLLPGISAFIGADIVAGLAFIDIMNRQEDSLFVDIGTNGEIVVWKNSSRRLLCCSTAAGPCFEGADISCSMNATDFIDAIAAMKRLGVMDETGALADEYARSGFPLAEGIVITQRDVRQFQLAKSAIFSGIKILCKTAGIKLSNFGRAHIAGELGFYLNLENAAAVGLLPPELAGKPAGTGRTTVCGNSSLKGAAKCLTDSTFLPRCREITAIGSAIDLAVDREFAEAFMENMTI